MTTVAAVPRRPLVVQLGGAGAIAGGLSQVVELYGSWPFARVEVELVPTRHLGSASRTVRRVVAAAVRVVAVRRSGRRVLLAAHLSQRGSFLREGMLARFGRAIGVPYVVHLHGSELARFAAGHARLVRFVLDGAKSVLVLTAEARAIVAPLVGADVRLVELVNAVDLPTPHPKDRTVVFGGVVNPRKGADVLLEAWTSRFAGSTWQLHLYGPVRMPLPELPANVFVHGAVDRDVLLAALDRSSVAVLPSRAEALPLFLLEAMAARNAVISTDVGAIATLLDHDAGVVVDPGDADALGRELQTLLTDAARLETLAGAARLRVESRHDTSALIRVLEDEWLSASGEHPEAETSGKEPLWTSRAM